MNPEFAFAAALSRALGGLGLTLPADAIQRLTRHYELLVAANREINLTTITDPEEAAVKHYADSLALVVWLEHIGATVHTVLDVGTGAGFPAIPVAVCRPDWQVTAIDGTHKKIKCVERFVEDLKLPNCRAIHAHSEHWAATAGRFDLILFRAVATIGECLARARRFCDHGSLVVCYKAHPLPDAEDRQANRICRQKRFVRLPAWPYRLTTPRQVIAHQLCGFRLDRGPRA